MASAAVCSKMGFFVVDSLLIIAPIDCGSCMFGPCFVMQYLLPFLILYST